MNNIEYTHIKELIGKAGLIVVTSHHNPDGDAIGSAIAMAALLRKAGKDTPIIVPNDYPAFLKWMAGSGGIVIYNSNEKLANDLISRADLIFCLDYNALHRTGAMEQALRNSSGKKILIDHHLEPVLDDFDLYLSEIRISSTSELVYRFIESCSWLDLIDQEVATGLFVGIMTDTGSFSFSCNFPETFSITAALIRYGINPEQIHRYVYDTYSENRLRLLGYCLSEKLTILPEFSTAFIALSKAELDRFNHQVGDTEGIVNYALSVENIKLAVLLTERKDRIRLSFRSKGNLSVNQIAREHFNGGGHKNAAGGDSFMSLEQTITRLKEVLGQCSEMISSSSF
ncbi:MAG: bifunctional oligoribonuclease/PAP phosphatase NrnA [Bacteroidales bacterium]|nr:bifunctional oligoribonuclease/PAP phosphatase NrnA [Bacteroidales bacterium]